ncbi:pyruvate decarboxylase-like protein [Zopfochytrium polystomum]|nr:pyruvate decarboxylase-like protein [Zopfochytrium polystomum]
MSILVGDYVFRRLKQVGVEAIHGVPGDYNLRLLDFVEENGLKWVGNANELNAGYAADGYARLKGMGVVITTFGVGELSAINAIAGAYAEMIPVLHIVGAPTTVHQKKHVVLHHTFGDGNFNKFAEMAKSVTTLVHQIKSADDAAEKIDEAILQCYRTSRPVYVSIPMDVVDFKVDSSRLNVPLNLSHPANDALLEKAAVDTILTQIKAAKRPIILVDACTIRHRALGETQALIKRSGLPTFIAPMALGAVDTSLKNYAGIFLGAASPPEVMKVVAASDLVLTIGPLRDDWNTVAFSFPTPPLRTIDINPDGVVAELAQFPGLGMHGVLAKLAESIPEGGVPFEPLDDTPGPVPHKPFGKKIEYSDTEITHAWLWPRVSKWLREDDIVIAETGTSAFGVVSCEFPKGVDVITSALWGSIGFAVPAAQGLALAAKELGAGAAGPEDEASYLQRAHHLRLFHRNRPVVANHQRRTVLFVGDGSLQLTVQALSTMLRLGLDNLVIFVVCNEGYTVERLIHGAKAKYNHMPLWRHSLLARAFGGKSDVEEGGFGTSSAMVAKTRAELDALLGGEGHVDSVHEASKKGIAVVEVFMPVLDAPEVLKWVYGEPSA